MKKLLIALLGMILLFSACSFAEEALQAAAPESVVSGHEITISWNQPEGMEHAALWLYDSQDQYITESYGTAMPTQHTLIANLEPDTYTAKICALDADWNRIDNMETSISFTVTGTPPAAPQVSADQTEVYGAERVYFTVTCPGAEKLLMRTAAYLTPRSYEPTGDSTVIEYGVYEDSEFQFCALVNGVWTLWSEPLPVAIKTDSDLAIPVLSMPSAFTAGDEMSVQWEPIEHAENMNIRIMNTADGSLVYDHSCDAAACAAVIETALPPGAYRLFATVHARHRNSNDQFIDFTVTGDLLPGPAFTLSETDIIRNHTAEFTVAMENAARFRLQYGRETLEAEAQDGQAVIIAEFRQEGAFECSISALVNGAWTEFGPAQTLTVHGLPQLDAPVVSVEGDIKAGETFTVTWTEAPGAAFYDVRIVPAEESENMRPVGDTLRNGELSYTHYNSMLTEGEYLVTVTANSPEHRSSTSEPFHLTMLPPDPDKALLYQSFGMMGTKVSSVAIYDYLAAEVPAEVVIPDLMPPERMYEQYRHLEHVEVSEEGLPVSGLSSLCLQNNGTLRYVTIPRSVTSIADNAFEGSVDLTIRGYTGTAAEGFARLHGYAFESLDGGMGDFTLTAQSDPIYVNKAAQFTIGIKGAKEIRMYVDGEKCSYDDQEKGQGTLISKKITTPGAHYINFVVIKNGETLYSPYLDVNVESLGAMPPLENMYGTATLSEETDEQSAITVERGTIVHITFTMPKGYDTFSIGTLESSDGSIFWYPNYYNANEESIGMTKDREITYTMSGLQLMNAGESGFVAAIKPEECYEETPSVFRIHVVSTRPFAYLEDYQAVFDYQGEETDIVVPNQVDGLPVVAIYNEAFRDSSITSVTVSEGIESIYHHAFTNCTALTDIHLPETLTWIQEYAFANCTALESVTLPSNLTRLPSALFRSCDNLKEVHLPENLAALQASNGESEYISPFDSCSKLKHVYFPGGADAMEKGCLPEGVTIHAPAGSLPHQYAEKYNHPFEPIEE